MLCKKSRQVKDTGVLHLCPGRRLTCGEARLQSCQSWCQSLLSSPCLCLHTGAAWRSAHIRRLADTFASLRHSALTMQTLLCLKCTTIQAASCSMGKHCM